MKILLLLLLSINGILTKDTHFDYFVFSQQWPPAVCIEAEARRHQCDIPTNVTGWVIHGLWPSKNTDKMGPFYCNNTVRFNESKIKPIEDELRMNWPNLFADSPELSFWKHEWEKHGTCAMSDKLTPDEFHYFSMGLNLHKKFNITSILGQSGIIPNTYTTYESTDFCDAVKKSLQIVPVVTCVYDRRNKHHYALQVEICVDKELKAIDCPEDYSVGKPNDHTLYYEPKSDGSCARNCPASKGIWYPPITP